MTGADALPRWAAGLGLRPHPEGGFYRETWRAAHTVGPDALPAGFDGPRSAGTAILFLLPAGQESAWHTVRGAELWLFHRGGPVHLHVGAERATAEVHLLGADLEAGAQPQLVVPPGHWQRARASADEAALVSCVVVPGFDFADFALAPPG